MVALKGKKHQTIGYETCSTQPLERQRNNKFTLIFQYETVKKAALLAKTWINKQIAAK